MGHVDNLLTTFVQGVTIKASKTIPIYKEVTIMTINQVYTILNSVASQLWGSSAVAVTDTTGFYSLGQSVSGQTDNFLSALVDRIGKTVVRTLDASLDFPGIMRHEFEFGAMLQKINVQPTAAQEAKWAEIGQPGFTPDQFKIDKPDVRVTYWKDSATFEFDMTIPDTLFKTAFESEAQMSAFISGIFKTLETSMTMYINYLTRGVVNAMIAEKLDRSHYVDLLTDYNSGHTPTLTAAEALESANFLKWAGRVIRNYIKYLEEPSVLYNEGDLSGTAMIRSTSRDNMHVLMNTSFVSSYTTYYEADVFNRELAEMPYFTEVKYWQGTGTTAPNDGDCMAIKVEIGNGNTVEEDYVIGVLADREAIATGLYDRFSAADRNNRQRYTNYTEGAMLQHIIDLSENVVVFTLGAPTITP